MSSQGVNPASAGENGADVAVMSQWQLILFGFRQHRLAVASLFLLSALYSLALFAEVVAPYTRQWKDLRYIYCPPQPPRFSFAHGLHVRAVRLHVDPVTFKKEYLEDAGRHVRLGLFVKGEPYRLWGLIPWDRHLVGVDLPAAEELHDSPSARAVRETARAGPPTFYLLGADKYGRDVFSRIAYGARISLSVGLAAIVVTFVIGITVGGVSGYVGGAADNVIQRSIEIINSFPRLPLWLALGAAMPGEWSPLRVYFAITIVLSLLGWTGLARVVRGKLLSLREEDYATAARLLGASHARVIFRHLLPGFTSHVIVSLTLRVPAMILGETSLSFLGLGLRPPIVSWGVMLQDCINMQVVANYPWILAPVVLIVTTVLCFNFLGDGLRDAADPYAGK